jgi:cell division protein FtsZ
MLRKRNNSKSYLEEKMDIKQQHISESFARIKVVGIGGGGCNTVNRMIEAGIPGIEFIAINTDNQSLMNSKAKTKVSLGHEITRGLGTGGDPEKGRLAAEESAEDLYAVLKGSDMVFIVAGMGGGTGTGASPIAAEIARELDALTIAVVTSPFTFEGVKRIQTAEIGIENLRKNINTLIVIPNDRLRQLSDKHTSFLDAFNLGDDPLKQAIECISELITSPGLVNRDFADVRTIMTMGGAAYFAVGKASGEDRAKVAAEMAITNKLLNVTLEGARGVLLNISGGSSLTIDEVSQAAAVIRDTAHPDVNLLFGATVDPNLGDEIRITVIATGFDQARMRSRFGRIIELVGDENKNVDESLRVSGIDFSSGNYNPSDMEIPTFLRKYKISSGESDKS